MFGVYVCDFDFFGVKIDPVKQPIECYSVGSGDTSHRRTSAFINHVDYRFVVFKNFKCGTLTRRFHVCGNMIDIGQLKILVL